MEILRSEKGNSALRKIKILCSENGNSPFRKGKSGTQFCLYHGKSTFTAMLHVKSSNSMLLPPSLNSVRISMIAEFGGWGWGAAVCDCLIPVT